MALDCAPILRIGRIKAGMLNVDDYLQIRLLHRDGVSAREIARRLFHGRDTVKKALVEATPRGYTRTRPVNCPKLGGFVSLIDQILECDRSAPKKQRHTAHRIFERLREEHQYLGGYDQVRRYVSSHRKRERETHLLLDHPPGCRLECDFGHIQVDFPEGRRQVAVLIAVWSYSHYPFVIGLPNERTESILHGTVCALEFFDCVPAELWWDIRRRWRRRFFAAGTGNSIPITRHWRAITGSRRCSACRLGDKRRAMSSGRCSRCSADSPRRCPA